MEEVLQRFTHIGQHIFEQLDGQDLVKCKKVGRNWKEFISKEKLVPFRTIKDDTNMSDVLIWKILRRTTVPTAMDLGYTLYTAYKIYPKEKGNINPKIIMVSVNLSLQYSSVRLCIRDRNYLK